MSVDKDQLAAEIFVQSTTKHDVITKDNAEILARNAYVAAEAFLSVQAERKAQDAGRPGEGWSTPGAT